MIKLALRNCLRNRKRTIVTGLSVMLAVFVVLMIMALNIRTEIQSGS